MCVIPQKFCSTSKSGPEQGIHGEACNLQVNLDDDVLGQGGFGTVYSGSLTGKRCAVKCLWGRTKVDDNIFLNELQALASMRRNPHPNVLKLMGEPATTPIAGVD